MTEIDGKTHRRTLTKALASIGFVPHSTCIGKATGSKTPDKTVSLKRWKYGKGLTSDDLACIVVYPVDSQAPFSHLLLHHVGNDAMFVAENCQLGSCILVSWSPTINISYVETIPSKAKPMAVFPNAVFDAPPPQLTGEKFEPILIEPDQDRVVLKPDRSIVVIGLQYNASAASVPAKGIIDVGWGFFHARFLFPCL